MDKRIKYSAPNDRDFLFYLRGRHIYTFCGTLTPHYEPLYDKNGVDGKQAFFSIDNLGRNIPTKHPNLLRTLLLVKSSVNFHIKMWAEGRADGTLPLIEFSQRLVREKYAPAFELDGTDMEVSMQLPEWVINAVENQKYKYGIYKPTSIFDIQRK